MAKMKWGRVQAEDRGRRHGYDQVETGPLCGPPHGKQDQK
jgi:hypothetical protein